MTLQTAWCFRGGIGVAFNGLAQSNSLDGRFNPPFVDNQPTLPCPAGPAGPGCLLVYANSFPADVHNPNGYAANPNAIVTFGPNNLPLPGSAPVSLTAFPADEPTTYTYHYTLGAEYELPSSLGCQCRLSGQQYPPSDRTLQPV